MVARPCNRYPVLGSFDRYFFRGRLRVENVAEQTTGLFNGVFHDLTPTLDSRLDTCPDRLTIFALQFDKGADITNFRQFLGKFLVEFPDLAQLFAAELKNGRIRPDTRKTVLHKRHRGRSLPPACRDTFPIAAGRV